MSPFEALYGQKVKYASELTSPIKRVVVGMKLLREMEEKMVKIKYFVEFRGCSGHAEKLCREIQNA
jgi:hypothetical protein